MDCIDHRWGRRKPVRIAVDITVRGDVISSGRLVNVSISGAALDTRAPLPMLTLVRIALPACPGNLDTEAAMAWVVRSTARGVGIEWCELAPPFVRRLLAAAGEFSSDAAASADIPMAPPARRRQPSTARVR